MGLSADSSPSLFTDHELPNARVPEPKIKVIEQPIWTENKARLIEAYLRLFVLVAKHGTYIDAFAGPQQADKPEMWSANLVLASEPKWFRHFHMFDIDKNQVNRLQALKSSQPSVDSHGKRLNREIAIYKGDFNQELKTLLESGGIAQKEATFCLLDQRTFECYWESVERLARYKSAGNNKIELFYFLAVGWLGRAVAAQQDRDKIRHWWGRDDYEQCCRARTAELLEAFVRRFKDELGYISVKPWPVYDRHEGGRIMYYMIHATDHPDAPELMSRAYTRAVRPEQRDAQLVLFQFLGSSAPSVHDVG